MRAYYPAASGRDLSDVAAAVAAIFGLTELQLVRESAHLSTRAAETEELVVEVRQFFGLVDHAQAKRAGPPDGWNLAWRNAVGAQFNYQVMLDMRDTDADRTGRRRLRRRARRLRTVFDHVRLHGDAR